MGSRLLAERKRGSKDIAKLSKDRNEGAGFVSLASGFAQKSKAY